MSRVRVQEKHTVLCAPDIGYEVIYPCYCCIEISMQGFLRSTAACGLYLNFTTLALGYQEKAIVV